GQFFCHFVQHTGGGFARQMVGAYWDYQQRDDHGDRPAKRGLQQSGERRWLGSATHVLQQRKTWIPATRPGMMMRQFFATPSPPQGATMPEDFLGLFRDETDVVSLQPGQELFRKGDAGRHMYVVKSGDLQVLDGNHVFETVSAGGIVGEMALVSEEPRSATVRAISESVVVPVDQKRFLF